MLAGASLLVGRRAWAVQDAADVVVGVASFSLHFGWHANPNAPLSDLAVSGSRYLRLIMESTELSLPLFLPPLSFLLLAAEAEVELASRVVSDVLSDKDAGRRALVRGKLRLAQFSRNQELQAARERALAMGATN